MSAWRIVRVGSTTARIVERFGSVIERLAIRIAGVPNAGSRCVSLGIPGCYHPPIVGYYGVFLDLDGRHCAVVGGGGVAERKIGGLLRARARVRVIAPEVTRRIADLADAGEVAVVLRRYRRGDLRGVFLAIAATDDEVQNRLVAAEAKEEGTLLNVVDAPDLCTFIAPALLERGDLRIAVSTTGAAPALAAHLRDRIGETVGPEYEATLRLLRALRERLRREGSPPVERQRILRELAVSDLPERLRIRDAEGVERLLRRALGPDTSLDDLDTSFA